MSSSNDMSTDSTAPLPESKHVAYLPMDILTNLDELKIGKRVDREKDYFFPVTFKGKVCHIETPKMLFMFDLKPYRTAGCKYDKYSIHLSLREICREAPEGHNVTNFKYMLENVDLFAMQDMLDEVNNYWSAIRPNYKNEKKPPTLTIKVPSDNKRLRITIVSEDGKEIYYPTIDQFRALFKHRNEVKCIIEMNPIWYANKRFGISYKLIKIQLAEAGRRSIQFR